MVEIKVDGSHKRTKMLRLRKEKSTEGHPFNF